MAAYDLSKFPQKPSVHTFKDLEGETFGRLKVIAYGGVRPNGKTVWICRCQCGAWRSVMSSSMHRKQTVSCGCKGTDDRTKHGRYQSRAWSSWKAMKARCLNSRHESFPLYGGRGISVCDRWVVSFQSFLDDMGEPPTSRHSIDRIDNDGNYEPGNCRWATTKQQCRNFRRNKLVTYRGETLCVADWADRLGIPYGCLITRLHRGWPTDRALSQRVQLKKG